MAAGRDQQVTDLPQFTPGAGDLILGYDATAKATKAMRLDAVSSSAPVQPGEVGVVDVRYPVGDVRRYGAKGDGATDDRAAIQAAIAAAALAVGGGRVVFQGGVTYLAGFGGTKTINGTVHRYSLTVPSGVVVDLSGATVKAAPGTNGHVFINADAGTGTTTDAGVINGVINYDQLNQAAPATGESSAVAFIGFSRARFDSLRFTNAREYAMRCYTGTESRFTNLYCDSSQADGFALGLGTKEITYSFFDNIRAENCAGVVNSPTQQGNGIIFTAQDCQIGKVAQANCKGGLKIQDTSFNLTIDQVSVRGGATAGANSGFKIQAGTGAPTNILVGKVFATGQLGQGLYLSGCTEVTVNQYQGVGNATGGTTADVTIAGPATRVRIDSILSAGSASIGVAIQNSSTFSLGRVTVRNSVGPAVQVYDGSGVIDSIDAYDTQGTPTMTRVFKFTGTGAGNVGRLRWNLAAAVNRLAIELPTAQNGWTTGPLEMGAADPPFGVVTLTAGNSTAVVNTNLTRAYVGGASDYVHPLIEFTPLNQAAQNLGVGETSFTIPDYTAGTGMTINHPPALGTEIVMWRLAGYALLSSAVAGNAVAQKRVFSLVVGTNQVVGARAAGWTVQTTAPARADMGAAPTLATVASTLAALIADVRAHGLIGT